MQVHVALTPYEFGQVELENKLAVVIDVFRFTTTALAALEAGAKSFCAVGEIKDAFDIKSHHDDVLLAGERQALPIPGFDFGNSPLEYQNADVQGKRLVFSTTNGTQAVKAACSAQHVLLACVRSISAVAQYIQTQKLDVVFLPAGLRGQFSLEDTWCAGKIISQISAELSDAAHMAVVLAQELTCQELASSAHGKYLKELGLTCDIEYCLARDASSGIVVLDPSIGWGMMHK